MKIKFVIILTLLVANAVALFGCTNTYDYERAAKDAEVFLIQNASELKDLFEKLMSENNKNSGKYKGNNYSYIKTNKAEYVQLDLNGQGMLGGQYWGIIYCPGNDIIDNGSEISIYDESQNGSGNNIFIKEKIKEDWYFYYDDYDGKVDITDIAVN